MIEVKNIKKSYGTLQVLKGIDLIIPEKQIVTIVGASGAGKSTLLHIIGTLDYPDEGEVWYEQDNVAHYSANKLANFRNNNIGFVFQFHHRPAFVSPFATGIHCFGERMYASLDQGSPPERGRKKSTRTAGINGIARPDLS